MRLRILEINTVRNWFIPQVGFLMRKLEIYAKYPIAYIQFFAQCNCCCAYLCRRPLILFTELSVLPVFFLCIIARILCRSILFDNYSMCMLSSPYNWSFAHDIEPSLETHLRLYIGACSYMQCPPRIGPIYMQHEFVLCMVLIDWSIAIVHTSCSHVG